MQLTEKEQAMIEVLRRQRDTWPALRTFMAFLALLLVAASAWEFYSAGWDAIPLMLLVAGAAAGSHTYRNWHGPPEASLLLKMLERGEVGPNA